MKIDVVNEYLSGEVKVLHPQVFEDERGFFMETFRADQFSDLDIPGPFVQDNHSRSQKGVLRGLHFQWNPPMGKLMRVTRGEAFLVAVDIRKGSPTLGQAVCEVVSEKNKLQVWAPAGFARGFCVMSDVAEIQYKVTGLYNAGGEGGIRWDDSDLNIDWPVLNPQLSEKDILAPTLKEWLATPESDHFVWKERHW